MINLHHGDCLEVMKDIPDNSIDFICCDPPYGTTNAKWDSVIDLDLMWEQLKRIIKPEGVVALFGAQPFTTTLINSNPKWYKYNWIWDKVRAFGFMYARYQPMRQHEDIVIFVNPEKGGKYNPQMEKRDESITSIESGGGEREFWRSDTRKNTYNPQMEKRESPVTCNGEANTAGGLGLNSLVAKKEKRDTVDNRNPSQTEYENSFNGSTIVRDDKQTYNPQMEKRDTSLTTESGGNSDTFTTAMAKKKEKRPQKTYTHRYPTSILKFKKESICVHPTQKPVDLLEYLIKTYTNEGEVVLDFTMGGGSCGAAAVQTGRDFIGIELEEKYFTIAKNRIESAEKVEKNINELVLF